MTLNERITKIEDLFDKMHGVSASSWQIALVTRFRLDYPELNDDLDFCFEVLAGKHKVGYTYHVDSDSPAKVEEYEHMTIKEFYDQVIRRQSTTDNEVRLAIMMTPKEWQFFFDPLVNREYKLGYSNKKNMVTDKHCMLAKSYPDHLPSSGFYYIQEKLNGNRCIAYFEDGVWKFTSRSQKPKDYPFDMKGLDPDRIYDGEVMRRGKMGNRDFASTSGLANSKYGDKSSLVYFIYDILDSELTYEERKQELDRLKGLSDDVFILKTLPVLGIEDAKVFVRKSGENAILDDLLDMIVDKGGEGLILRDPNAKYYHSRHSGDRKPYLLKYKQVKTCDLRIVGYNEGKGKYEGMIGSLICQSDDGKVEVSVAGITDEVRDLPPDVLYGRIIEIAYFEMSKAKDKDIYSLQFPRFKRWRPDKTETSMF